MGFINVIAGFLLTWAAIFFCWGLIKRGKLTRILSGQQEYGVIESHISDRSVYFSGAESHLQNFEITYRFEYEGIPFRNRQPVSKMHYQQWSDGDRVTVLFLQDNPQQSILAEDRTYEKQVYAKTRPLFLLGLLGLLLLVLEIYLVIVFIK